MRLLCIQLHFEFLLFPLLSIFRFQFYQVVVGEKKVLCFKIHFNLMVFPSELYNKMNYKCEKSIKHGMNIAARENISKLVVFPPALSFWMMIIIIPFSFLTMHNSISIRSYHFFTRKLDFDMSTERNFSWFPLTHSMNNIAAFSSLKIWAKSKQSMLEICS